jgi:hypothetical protein
MYAAPCRLRSPFESIGRRSRLPGAALSGLRVPRSIWKYRAGSLCTYGWTKDCFHPATGGLRKRSESRSPADSRLPLHLAPMNSSSPASGGATVRRGMLSRPQLPLVRARFPAESRGPQGRLRQVSFFRPEITCLLCYCESVTGNR